MINTLHKAAPWLLIATSIFAGGSAFAQQPTEAQRDAIRSECRSDYEAHCSSIQPGGAASLQCLEKNMSSLSAACQKAVKAVEAPAAAPAAAAPKAEESTKPAEPAAAAKTTPEPSKTAAPAEPKAAAAPAGKKPTSAQTAAVKSACRSDYPKVCASVPPGGEAALECLEKNKAKVSKACQQAVAAIAGGAAAPAAAASAPASGGSAATPAAAPAVDVIVVRPLLPREELAVLRTCGGDVRALCGAVAPGGGRIVQCLAARAAAISPICKDVLSQFRVAQ